MIDEKAVAEIRAKAADGEGYFDLSAEYKITAMYVRDLVKGVRMRRFVNYYERETK
jgi:hypothetical protein